MDSKTDRLLEEIKKLLILQLVKGGAPASIEEVGDSLGITGRTVRNIATSSKKPRKNNSVHKQKGRK